MKGNKRGVITRVRILAFLHKNARDHPEGPPPSVEEIREAVGLKSKGATLYQLRCLRELGLIDWIDGKARSIEVLVNDEEPGQPD